MNKVIIIVLSLLMSLPSTLFSQNKMSGTISDVFSDRTCRSDFTDIQLNPNQNVVDAVIAHFSRQNSNFTHKLSDLLLQHKIESPIGVHLTFEQFYNNIPVFNSQVKVNLNKSNKIQSVFDNSYNTDQWNRDGLLAQLSKLDENKIIAFLLKNYGVDKEDITGRKVLAVVDESPSVYYEAELYHPVNHQHRLLLIDNHFKIILDRDLNSYAGKPLAQGTGLVFLPDPLTTAHVKYGAPYIDDNDADIVELNNERVQVDLTVTQTGNTYTLENESVKIAEFSAPIVQPVTRTGTPNFEYTRSESGFEDVNTFYHISEYHDYVVSLDSNFKKLKVLADAHALDSQDNSMYSNSSAGPRLFFGEGGVDDAEDADVVVHEYGHALSDHATFGVNTNVGSERQALDEGLCDYFAASYSMSIDTFCWEGVFSWDGHNEFWDGRTVASDKKYPRDLIGNMHLDGEIWSSAMMQIFNHIGREKTDKLQLLSLYSYAQNMAMKDAAQILIEADDSLFQGENFCVIYNVMMRRGLMDTLQPDPCWVADKSIQVNAGDDMNICSGDTAVIGNSTYQNPNYIYKWGPSVNLVEPNSITTKAYPVVTTSYTLTAITLNGSYNEDQVTVAVNQCKIIVVYTRDFYAGKDDNIAIMFPDNSKKRKIELFDVAGKEVLVVENIPTSTYMLNGNLFATGAYVLRVSTHDKCKNKKIVKLW